MDDKKISGKKRGAILIITFMVIVMLVIISMGIFVRMFSESRAAERHRDNAVAFYLAEAAVDSAIKQLPSNLAPATGVVLGTGNGIGRYSFTITTLAAGSEWEIVGTGYVPDIAAARAQKTIRAVVAKRELGDFFWENAITSAGPVNFNGNKFVVTSPPGYWDVRYGNTIFDDHDRIEADKEIKDTNVSPLPLLDFQNLLAIAAAQNHVYTGYDSSMPTTFYYDQAAGIPNVVYIQGELDISGKTKVGGFIIVGGDVIQNVDISGNAAIDGCIYTRGSFRNTGGGNQSININGGIWAGDAGCTLNGSIVVAYNKEYMDAIRYNLNPSTVIQLISWREE